MSRGVSIYEQILCEQGFTSLDFPLEFSIIDFYQVGSHENFFELLTSVEA